MKTSQSCSPSSLRHFVGTTSSSLNPLQPGASVTSPALNFSSLTIVTAPSFWTVTEMPVSPASLPWTPWLLLGGSASLRTGPEVHALSTRVCRILWLWQHAYLTWGHSHSILCLIKEQKVTNDCPTRSPLTLSSFDLKIKYHLYFYLPSKNFWTMGAACCVREIFLHGEEAFLWTHSSACSAHTHEEEGMESQRLPGRPCVCV